MAIQNTLKVYNILLFTISGVLFLTSALSQNWTTFKLYEKNSTYAFTILPRNNNTKYDVIASKYDVIASHIEGKFNLLKLWLRVKYNPSFSHNNLNGTYTFDERLPLPNRIGSMFDRLAPAYYTAFTMLLIASILMFVCIGVEIKKIIEDKRNSVKYYKLAIMHVVLAALACAFGLVAVVMVTKSEAYHMSHIYDGELTLTVKKNLSSIVFLLGEGICFLSMLGCIAEMRVWKKSLPGISSNKNFENQNFDTNLSSQAQTSRPV